MALVAISSPYGAGGSRVAPALAKRLGVPFLDRPAGTEPEHEEAAAACCRGSARSGSRGGRRRGWSSRTSSPATRAGARSRRSCARCRRTGGGVVLGRAAAVLLRDDPRVLRVLLTGPPERRIEQAMAIEGIDRATAARRLERTDRARLAYHQTLYCVDPRKPELYHLWSTRPRSRLTPASS